MKMGLSTSMIKLNIHVLIKLFRTMYCGTGMQYSTYYSRTLSTFSLKRGILSVPQNIVMNMNNVMLTLGG